MIQRCLNTDAIKHGKCWDMLASGGTHRASSSRDNSSRGCFFEIKDNAEKNKHVRIPFCSLSIYLLGMRVEFKHLCPLRLRPATKVTSPCGDYKASATVESKASALKSCKRYRNMISRLWRNEGTKKKTRTSYAIAVTDGMSKEARED